MEQNDISKNALLVKRDSKFCSKGHEMDIFHECQQNSRRVKCNTFRVYIDVEKGLNHCCSDKEDYHVGCGYLNNTKQADD